MATRGRLGVARDGFLDVDGVERFLREECVVDGSRAEGTKSVFAVYWAWAVGRRNRWRQEIGRLAGAPPVMSKGQFQETMELLGYERRKHPRTGRWEWTGVGIDW